MASIMAHPWAKHSKWVIDQSESALNLLLYIKKLENHSFHSITQGARKEIRVLSTEVKPAQ